MIERPLDLLHNSSLHCKLQKDAFRDEIQSYAEGLGYSVSAEKIPFGGTNLVFGDSKNAKYLVTSCYDLSCVATLLEIAGSVPQIHRNRVCFVLFDQKIFGLFGSGFYAKFHKAETKNQIVLHLASVELSAEEALHATSSELLDRLLREWVESDRTQQTELDTLSTCHLNSC